MSVSKSKIEWCDSTWSPVTGCDKVSAGCDHCYAETIANRFAGTKAWPNGFQVMLRPERLDQPLRWQKPRRIFVNSTSDLFHDDIPDEYLAQVFAVIALTPRHTFQCLTKRHGRMRSLLADDQFIRKVWNETESILPRGQHPDLTDWPLPNLWLGVSAENQKWADIRIPALLDTPATVRFVSAEPLLGPIDLRQHLTFECPVCYRKAPWTDGRVAGCDGADINEYWCQTCPNEIPLDACAPQLHWVIAGGESGRDARPMHADWARSLRDQCVATGTAFHFKQHGEYTCTLGPDDPWRTPDVWVNKATGETALLEETALQSGGDWTGAWRVGKKHAGRQLDDQTWDQYPTETVVSSIRA